MRRVSVDVDPRYEIVIAPGAIADCGAMASHAVRRTEAAMIADSTTDALFGDAVAESFARAGVSLSRHKFHAGEDNKTLSTVSDLLESVAASGLSRSGMIVALGGGVVGDVAGFVASCYMRGVPFVQIPTTLLAMVDSSVGGKTGVDLAAGKNLCGAFHQPSLVVCDTDALRSLPDEQVKNGMGEVIKYAMGFDAEIFGMIGARYEDLVARCLEIKAGVVERDERESGERKKLNLGHTAAHAIERLSGFRIAHGAAVAMGTRIVAAASAARGTLSRDALDALDRALASSGLDARCPYGAAELARAAASDKKRSGSSISIVMPTAAGSCEIADMPTAELEALFAQGLE